MRWLGPLQISSRSNAERSHLRYSGTKGIRCCKSRSRHLRGVKNYVKAPFWTRDLLHGHCACGSLIRASACCHRGGLEWSKDAATIQSPTPSAFGHPRCYFREQLSCDNKLSREHVISHAVLKVLARNEIRIKGAAWQEAGTEASIPIKTFSSKVLCLAHNRMLSPLDTTAGVFAEALLAINGKPQERNSGKRFFRIVSGIDVERWMLKVYCGALAAGLTRKSDKNRAIGDIDRQLIDLILGYANWPTGWGLFNCARVGEGIQTSRDMQFTLAFDEVTRKPAGLIMHLVGFRFFLSLSDRLRGASAAQGFIHHLESLQMGRKGKAGLLALSY